MKNSKPFRMALLAFAIAYFYGFILNAASEKPAHEEAVPEVDANGSHGADEDAVSAPPEVVDPASKYDFYNNVQSFDDLDEKEKPEVHGELPEVDETGAKIVYLTPESCKEFSVYMNKKRLKLADLEAEIEHKKQVLEKLQAEFAEVTKKYSEVEGRVKKLIQRDPNDLKDNPELAKMTRLYESLPSEEAAARLKNLDLDLTLALLKGMKPKKLSQIMSALEPRLAAALSSQMIRGF